MRSQFHRQSTRIAEEEKIAMLARVQTDVLEALNVDVHVS